MKHVPRSHRSGVTLIELILVILVASSLLGTAGALLSLALRADRGGREHVARNTALESLARGFREDVHAARQAELVRRGGREVLRLPLGDGAVEYEVAARGLVRIRLRNGAAHHRETYAFACTEPPRFRLDRSSGTELVQLTLVLGTVESGTRRFRIEAVLARDHRFVPAIGEKP